MTTEVSEPARKEIITRSYRESSAVTSLFSGTEDDILDVKERSRILVRVNINTHEGTQILERVFDKGKIIVNSLHTGSKETACLCFELHSLFRCPRFYLILYNNILRSIYSFWT